MKMFFILLTMLFMPLFSLFAESIDGATATAATLGVAEMTSGEIFQQAFNFIVDFFGGKWSVVFVVVGVLATLLTVYNVIIAAYESYCIATPDKRDDEKLEKFKNHKITKIVLYILTLCKMYKPNKK